MDNLKNWDPNSLDINYQIELIRRQLVLKNHGIKVPKDPATGEINVKEVKQMKISEFAEKDKNIVQTINSPIKLEKPTSSIIS